MVKSGHHVVGREGRSIATEFSHATLQQLLTGELACIWHKRWFDVSSVKHMLEKLYEIGRENLPDGTGVRSIGPQVGCAFGSEAGAMKYFADSRLFWNHLRENIFAGLQNPIDALLDAFGDTWHAGAELGSNGGDSFAPGVFRWFQCGSSLNPHVDTATEPLIASFCCAARLAANIYMDTTPTAQGGHLELWDLALTGEQFELARAPDFSLRRAAIGPPALSLSPATGDLILFDAERIHAVSPVLSGTRVTASTFIGFGRLDGPAVFFA